MPSNPAALIAENFFPHDHSRLREGYCRSDHSETKSQSERDVDFTALSEPNPAESPREIS